MDHTPTTYADGNLPEPRGDHLPDSNRCQYCGAVLNPEFYFCTYCSTPYRNHVEVLPDQPVKPIEDRVRLQRAAPQVVPFFYSLVGFLLVASILAAVLPEEHTPSLWIIESILLAVLVLGFSLPNLGLLTEQLRRIGFLKVEAWLGLAALVPLMALNLAYSGLIRALLGAEDFSFYQFFSDAGYSPTVAVMVVCVGPAIIEEVGFRGLVLPWLLNAFGPWKALVFSSGLFMVLHFSLLGSLYLFLVGMLLGWVWLRTRSLYPPMLIHFLHNVMVLELG